MAMSILRTLPVAVSSLLAAAGLIHAQGIITTVAGTGSLSVSSTGDGGPATSAGLAQPAGVAVDSSGNVYVAERFSNLVRKITAATGVISRFAGGGAPASIGEGGPATMAGLVFNANDHVGLAVDSGGNLYIADSGNNRVRKVNSGGTITTVHRDNGSGTAPTPASSVNAVYSEAGGCHSPQSRLFTQWPSGS